MTFPALNTHPRFFPFNQPLRCSPTRRLPPGEEVLLGDQPDAASFLLGFAQGGQSHLIPAEVPEKQTGTFCGGIIPPPGSNDSGYIS